MYFLLALSVAVLHNGVGDQQVSEVVIARDKRVG